MESVMPGVYKKFYNSPLGWLELVSDSEALLMVSFVEQRGTESADIPDVLVNSRRQMEEYFDGRRREFDLPLMTNGTEFQEKVWAELKRLAYGETVSYGEIAKRIDNPRAVRAVGGACNRNPIGIVIPCHRVIGADGSLTGFAPGTEFKRKLLEMEREK